jgi:GTP cyclohydrolase IA
MKTLFSDDCVKQLELGLGRMLQEVTNPAEDFDHIERTPHRVVLAYQELLGGVWQDPAAILQTSFKESSYNQMITVESIDFVSVCIHHLLPFYGECTFAYLPDKRIVGLSKIPRMVDILAHRPQVQERLTQQIVDTFQNVVNPLGCGATIRAWHGCVACRGVRKANVRMRTTALRGYFLDKPEVRQEFLAGVNGHGK